MGGLRHTEYAYYICVMLKYTVSFLILVLFVGACAERVDYVGTSYPPTAYVDLYFSEADVEEDYVVMGHAIAQAGTHVSTRELQEELLEEARERGADGVIIRGFDRVAVGETTQERSSGATTSVEEERRIDAIFIKYKRNL